MHNDKGMTISIWFFIGSLLVIYGVLIAGADVYYQGHPAAQNVVLSELRTGLWWGLFLLAFGLFYCVKFWPKRG